MVPKRTHSQPPLPASSRRHGLLEVGALQVCRPVVVTPHGRKLAHVLLLLVVGLGLGVQPDGGVQVQKTSHNFLVGSQIYTKE